MLIRNLSGKPDNIVLREQKTIERCEEIESALPSYLRPYFMYLGTAVLPNTRFAYLNEILNFFEYLIDSGYTAGRTKEPKEILEKDLFSMTADEINLYLNYLRRYKKVLNGKETVITNDNKALARKKAAIKSLYKFLFHDGKTHYDITGGINPVRVPKKTDSEIKVLEDSEVKRMLDIVSTGGGLTKTQIRYWNKTKYRDKAMLLLFVTYGLRLSELAELNVSSFNFMRNEFTIYRKGAKERAMPLNEKVGASISIYLAEERPDMEGSPERDALFVSLQKKRLTEKAIRETVKKYTALALGTGIGYSPHKLRATTATSLIGRGASIYDVQELLDHGDVSTTQIYARHQKGVVKSLVERLEDWE